MVKMFLKQDAAGRRDILGRRRQPLPAVPLSKLSKQQLLIYNLAANHSTREISQILSIPEKQVRQVYSAIRSKSGEFANKNVHLVKGAEPALYDSSPGVAASCSYNFISELVQDNGEVNYTCSELFVMENIKKGISVREITKLTGKSIQSIRKTHQRAKKKLCHKGGFYDDNCITKVDTGNTYVSINRDLIRTALEKANLSREQIAGVTGILPERMEEIEKHGTLSYDELFLLIKHIKINPYGPSEKDDLLKKLSDTYWIKTMRAGVQDRGCITPYEGLRRKINRNKSIYLNRVVYYGTAHYRYNGSDGDRPIVEDGRNGLFPLKLTREQLAECGWILEKFMIRPVYTYRYPGLAREIMHLERMLDNEKDEAKANKYRRELSNLKGDIVSEDGSSIFIISKNQLLAINKFLFGP